MADKKKEGPKLIEAKIAGTNLSVYVKKTDSKKFDSIKLLKLGKGIRKEISYEF